MNNYFYSAKNNAFVMAASTLLKTPEFSDAVEVGDEVFAEFFQFEKNGQRRAAGPDGLPVWEDFPEPSEEELHLQAVTEAELKKSSLMAQAAITIAPLQDAVDLEMATDEEQVKLADWKKFRVLINRIDTALAPDINWPKAPINNSPA